MHTFLGSSEGATMRTLRLCEKTIKAFEKLEKHIYPAHYKDIHMLLCFNAIYIPGHLCNVEKMSLYVDLLYTAMVYMYVICIVGS